MPLALWTLLWLNFRALLRKTGRQLRTVRGILFFIVGLAVLGFWIGPSIFLNARMPAANRGITLATAPLGILLLTLLNLFTSAGERAVTFTPAEIDFLFPGPFSRRQLLIYKLIKTGFATIFSALIFSVVLGRLGGTFFCRLTAVWLLFQFFQLLAMVIALLQSIVGERIIRTGKWWILIVLGIAFALAVLGAGRTHFEMTPAFAAQVQRTVPARIVLAPFKIFARALLARSFIFQGLFWSSIAAAMDLLLAGVVIGLDANFLETSATVSARRYDRVARMRRSGIGGMARANSSGWKIKMLPWLAGTGPIIWRQLTTALRTSRKLLIVLCIVAIAAGVFMSRKTDLQESITFIIMMTVYLNLFASQALKFDFRGDLDHLDVLRSLPLRAAAIAAAQLTIPGLLLSMIHLLLIATVAIAGHLPPTLLLMLALFAIPLNFLVLAIDNLMFLLFPFRPGAAVAGDMTLIGRQSILFICRFLLILVVAATAGGLGFAIWLTTSHSWLAAGITAWLTLVGSIAFTVWGTGVAFQRFDPSVSTPT